MASRAGKARWPRRLLRFLLLLVGGFVAASVLVVGVLRFVPPPTSSFILQARIGAALADEPVGFRREWQPMSRISPNVALAVVASEDQLFLQHRGFDFASIRKAMEHNERSPRIRGASTISQQVAKNLFLWSGRSWVRKGLEAWFTVLVETLWSKRRILEVYLNFAEFGRGTYGVEAAAQRYYGRGAAALTPAQAARLAAVLPSPRRLRVDRPSAYVMRREREILGQMTALGGTGYLAGL